MPIFTVPILQLPAQGVLDAPETVPVIFEHEHVATAERNEGNYEFQMFWGNLAKGLTKGSLLLKPRFTDETRPDRTTIRKYVAVEIVHEENFDIHRTEG